MNFKISDIKFPNTVDKTDGIHYNINADLLCLGAFNQQSCRCGEIGRRKGLKIPRWQHRTGSSPVTGTRMPFRLRIREALINE